MLYKAENNSLKAMSYYDYSDLEGKEKDLENLLAENLGEIYIEDGQLMPIFQERQWQEEPDLCALDKNGNLVIFELKRGNVQGDTTIQVMRYAQIFGQKTYHQLNELYKKYANTNTELKIAHAENFGLENDVLKEEQFNKSQKLVIVGNSSDVDLINAVDYWKNNGIDIDFLPYRFYKISKDIYFEFFAKPYDYHINPKNCKGVIFDTNLSYNENSAWDMLANSKVSAYGNAKKYISYLNKGDYVLYYHKGYGVIAVGYIKSSKPTIIEKNDEAYHKVVLFTPQIKNIKEACYISPSELSQLLSKNFYYASTIKTPYLTKDEVILISEELGKRYKEKNKSK